MAIKIHLSWNQGGQILDDYFLLEQLGNVLANELTDQLLEHVLFGLLTEACCCVQDLVVKLDQVFMVDSRHLKGIELQ